MKLPKIYQILGLFILMVVVFFWRSWIKGEIPMPGDHLLGIYRPWLDYSWSGYPAGVPVKNPEMADVPSLFYPQKTYSMGRFKTGDFPLWNPMIFNGYPLMANFQSGVLNPFNIYFLLFSPTVAWTLYIATQPFLALVFMYFFLRFLKINRLSAVLGSVIFAFCGFNLLWLEYGIHGYVTAYLPLLFLLVSRKQYFYISVILAAQLFSGYPQLSLYTLIFLGLWHLWYHKAESVSVFRYLFSVFLGLGICGILLLPGMELFHLSQRVGEPLSGSVSGAYYQWRQLITLIAPDFYGNPATYNTWGGVAYTNNTGYASVIGFCLAVAGLVLAKNRLRWFFLLLFGGCLFISLPSPVSGFIQHLPLFSASVATRIMVFCGFSTAVLAAFGLNQIFKIRKIPIKIFIIWPVIFFILSVFAIYSYHLGQMVGLRNLIIPFMFSMASLAAVWSITKKSFIGTGILILLVTFELFRFGWKYNPFFPAGLIFPMTPEIAYLQKDNHFRLDGGDVLPLSVWMGYGLSSSTGYDAVYPGIWAKYLSAIDTGNILTPKGRLGDLLSYNSRLFDLTGTGYVLALKHNQKTIYPRFLLPKLIPVLDSPSLVIFQNNQALPKYSLKTSYETIADNQGVINRLQDPDFNYQTNIVLNQNPYIINFPTAFKSSLVTIFDRPQHQEFEVISDQPVFLLNTGVYYPGWYAKIDQVVTPIYQANFAFQAVQVPAGIHRVEFTYQPLSLTIGICVSLISLIILYAGSRRSSPQCPSRLV